MNPNWKSRKWLLTLVVMGYGVVIHVFPSVADKVNEDQVKSVLTVILTWLGVEGGADIVSRLKKGDEK